MKTVAQFLLTFLLNASWQILLIAAVASLCDLLLRATAARHRHAVWVVALFFALFLPALSTAANFSAPQPISVLAEPKLESAPVAVVVTRISSLDGDEIESAKAKTSAVPPVPAKPERNWWSPVRLKPGPVGLLVAIYALMVLYALLRLVRAWLRTRKIVRTAFEVEMPEAAQSIIDACGRAIATRRVRVLCSSSIPVPITLGVLRPVIILPQSLLNEIDENLLISAVGHELVHIARRDYLTNLIYEFVYLPVWFHPAAWLIRRRIRQTRELCCDEQVTAKLLRPEVYARSLVRMMGTSPLAPRMAADTTIGIVESDNLEGRIMSLLKSRKLTGRRKNILLLLASLLLAVPCIAATPFALSFEINAQEPSAAQRARELAQKQERLVEELQRNVEQLKAQERLATPSRRAEIETKLREVQQNLEEQERLIQLYRLESGSQSEAQARLSEVRRNLVEHARLLEEYQQKEAGKSSRELGAQTTMAELLAKYPNARITREGQILEDQKLLEELQAKLVSVQNTRRPRVIHRVEPVYPADARDKNIKGSVVLTMVVDREGNPQDIKIWKSLYPSMDQAALEAARQMRFEPALKDGQTVPETLLVEFYFSTQNKHVEVMGYGEGRGDGKGVGYASGQGSGDGAGYDGAVREMRRRKEQEGQDDRARRHAELTQGASLSMDRAIQIATSKYPGKVLACSLGRDKDGPVFYHIVIIVTEGDKTVTKYVWVSAVDGTILKTEDEKRAVSSGKLNGKALSLPNPEYPPIARAAKASGEVTIQITVDKQGNVISATAVGGHPLLQSAAVAAARQAKFSPTYLQGQPVEVKGQLVYNFVLQ